MMVHMLPPCCAVAEMLQVQPKEADTLGNALLKIDNHALISYTPTAADKAFKDKLRSSRDRRERGVRERDRDVELRSPRAAKRDKSEDQDKKFDDKEPKKEGSVAADGQDKEVSCTLGVVCDNPNPNNKVVCGNFNPNNNIPYFGVLAGMR